MTADIITIGDELLIGQITDTNSKWIAEKINLLGFKIRQITSVADEKDHIINVVVKTVRELACYILIGSVVGYPAMLFERYWQIKVPSVPSDNIA